MGLECRKVFGKRVIQAGPARRKDSYRYDLLRYESQVQLLLLPGSIPTAFIYNYNYICPFEYRSIVQQAPHCQIDLAYLENVPDI